MARVAFCLAGSLTLSLGLFAIASDATAGPTGARGHRGAHFRSTSAFHRGHGTGRFRHARFGHFRGSRFGGEFPLFFGSDWPGDYGPYGSYGAGVEPVGYPVASLVGLPATLGIQAAPVMPPAVYVIHAAGTYSYRKIRKGHSRYPGPRVLSMHRGFAPDPLRADLAGLPPITMHVGSEEILLEDAVRLARRARAAGVPVDLRRLDGLWHVAHASAGLVTASTAAVNALGGALATHLSRAPGLGTPPTAG
jgi:hypothetical protein